MAGSSHGTRTAAWPGSQPQSDQKPAPREQGIAPKGWFQEAEKDFRKR